MEIVTIIGVIAGILATYAAFKQIKQRPNIRADIKKFSGFNIYENDNNGFYRPIYRILLELTNKGKEATTIKDVNVTFEYLLFPEEQYSNIQFVTEMKDENEFVDIPFLIDLLPGQTKAYYFTFSAHQGISKNRLREYQRQISEDNIDKIFKTLKIIIHDGQENRFLSPDMNNIFKNNNKCIRIVDKAVEVDEYSGFCWVDLNTDIPFKKIQINTHDFTTDLYDKRYNIYNPRKEIIDKIKNNQNIKKKI